MADVAAFLNDTVVIVAERLNAITPPGRPNRRWRPVSRCENWFHIVITTVCQAVRGTRARSSAVGGQYTGTGWCLSNAIA